VDQFTEPDYLPQHLRVAAMGRRKIEIKAIKDDRNRSVYVSGLPFRFEALQKANGYLIEHFSSAKAACSRRRMSFQSFVRSTSQSLSLAIIRSCMSTRAVILERS
jgi:hypothetical protein